MYTSVFLLLMYNIIFVNIKNNDFSQMCKNGTLTVVYVISSYHYIILLWKQSYLAGIREDMKNDYALAKSLPEKEQELVCRYATRGGSVCKQWMLLSVSSTGIFVVKNIVSILLSWINGEFQLIPFYDLVYPSFIEDRKDSVAIFAFTYFLLLSFGTYASSIYAAFMPLGPYVMLHACGQLEVVKLRIEDIFNSGNAEEMKEKLKVIVKQLQYIYDFVDRINVSFSVIYELTLKTSTIILPITCYEVLESLKRGEMSLEFLTFIFGGILSSSFPCYYSDLLMEKGEDVRLAIYFSGWERIYNRGIRSTVCIILQRALRPVVISTLFHTLSLDTLTDVFQQAYTIFNLMNAALKL